MTGIDQATEASLLDRLRAKRARLAGEKTTDIPVAGYGGELVARYRLLDPLVEGKEIGNRVTQQFKGAEEMTERVFYAEVDLLIRACDGLFVKVDGELVPLDPDGTGIVDFEDSRIGEFLGFEAETARLAVLEVFGGNKIAVDQHAQLLQKWMGDTTGELNQGVFG